MNKIIQRLTRNNVLKTTSRHLKCFALLLPLLAASCTSEDLTSGGEGVEAVYKSLSTEEKVVWDYFLEHRNCSQVQSTGIVRHEEGQAPVGGFADLHLRFSFTGKPFTLGGKLYVPQREKGIPFDELKLLPLAYLRPDTTAAETQALYNDANINPEMIPTRVKVNYTLAGEFEEAFVYFEGIPSKTNPKVTYTIDFLIF